VSFNRTNAMLIVLKTKSKSIKDHLCKKGTELEKLSNVICEKDIMYNSSHIFGI